MENSNLNCVHCKEEIPLRKIIFKGIANRHVICPECDTKQFIALPALIIEYVIFLTAMILLILNMNFIQKPFIFGIVIIIFLSSFIMFPLKKLVATR